MICAYGSLKGTINTGHCGQTNPHIGVKSKPTQPQCNWQFVVEIDVNISVYLLASPASLKIVEITMKRPENLVAN